MQKQSTDLISK